MEHNGENIAVLIDADNTSHSLIDVILEEVARYGTSYVKQVYGDWSSPSLKNWKEKCLSHGLVAIQQFTYTANKNATDIAMVIDAMDLLHSQQFNAFCIVSSDSDFTGLVSRIRKNGIKVYGIGKESTPEAFRKSCDKYIFIDNFIEKVPVNNMIDNLNDDNNSSVIEIKKIYDQKSLRADLPLLKLIRNAIKENDRDTGWSTLRSVGKYIHKMNPEFDSRNYGYSKLSELIEVLGLFKLKAQENTLHITCALPKNELKKVRKIIKKHSSNPENGALLKRDLISQSLKENGIYYKEAFGCKSLTSFLKKNRLLDFMER